VNVVPLGVAELDAVTADTWASFVAPDSVVIATEVPGIDLRRTDISAQVSIGRDATATVVVACDEASSHDLARRMFELADDAVPSADEVEDALGELANVVGGNLKALAPLSGELTLPQVLLHEQRVDWPDRLPQCGVDVVWAGGRATLLVWTPARAEEPP
jgi:chemotaxis protein CheX